MIKHALARLKTGLTRKTGIEWSAKRLGPHSSAHVQTVLLLRHFEVDTVLDIGANIGQFGAGLLDFGFEGRLISFEPVERVHRQLSNRAKRYHNWIVPPPCALGSTCEKTTINISAHSVFSSLLPIKQYHAKAKPQSRIVDTQEVSVITLDSLVEELSIEPERTLLKIDTQGYEREVILGATNLIASGLKGIKTEMPLFPIYEGTSWLFGDIYAFLNGSGYQMYALRSESVDCASGRTNTLDGTFFQSGGREVSTFDEFKRLTG